MLARVLYYEENGFKKNIVLSQVKAEKINKMGGVLQFLPLKLMDKHANTRKTNQYLKIFPELIEIFLQKHVKQGHMVKKNRF